MTNRIVLPDCFQMRSSSRFIFSRVSASSAPNGSSISTSFGIVDQRARDRGALLHAARELVGALVLGAGEADEREQVARRSRLAFTGRPRISAGSRTLSMIVRHFSSSGCWNTMPMSRAGSNGMRRRADRHACRRRADAGRPGSSAACVLPQPDGPTSDTSSPGIDVEASRRRSRDASSAPCGRPCATLGEMDERLALMRGLSSISRVAHDEQRARGRAP